MPSIAELCCENLNHDSSNPAVAEKGLGAGLFQVHLVGVQEVRRVGRPDVAFEADAVRALPIPRTHQIVVIRIFKT